MIELSLNEQMNVSGGAQRVQLPLLAYTGLVFMGSIFGACFGYPIAGAVAGLTFCLGYENGADDAIYQVKKGYFVIESQA